MKNNGFTLIELLAVIVILAIIALIATPIILNIINDSRKGAFLATANNVEDAIKIYYADQTMDDNEFIQTTFDFRDNIEDLNIDGETPAGGSVTIDENGKVLLAVYDSSKSWCAIKKENDSNITVIDYNEDTCDYLEYTDESCFTFNSDNGTITGYDANCSKDVVIPKKIGGVKVTTIGSTSFFNKKITSVVIPNTIISIEAAAFYGNELTNVVIPYGVTSIGNSSFMLNYKLTSVKIPNSVTYIGDTAFNSHNMSYVEIPSSVTYVGDTAFQYGSLKSVKLNEGLITIGSGAFFGNELTNIEIPSTVTTIEDLAFGWNFITNAIIKGKTSISDFESYPSSSPFIWKNGSGDANIIWKN